MHNPAHQKLDRAIKLVLYPGIFIASMSGTTFECYGNSRLGLQEDIP